MCMSQNCPQNAPPNTNSARDCVTPLMCYRRSVCLWRLIPTLSNPTLKKTFELKIIKRSETKHSTRVTSKEIAIVPKIQKENIIILQVTGGKRLEPDENCKAYNY